METTWEYRVGLDPDGELPDEWVWERLRIRRDKMLAGSDFRVLPDSPFDVEAWAAYRQALRDLPENTDDPRSAPWPVEP
jgi:hypothetical protein